MKYLLLDYLLKLPGGGFLRELYYFIVDSIRVFRQRLPSIDLQLKIQNRVNDGITEFLYGDRQIRFFVPYAGIDGIQSFVVDKAQFWEASLLEATRKYLTKDSVVADCGANVGNHTVFWAKVCNVKKIFAFEPQTIIGAILRRNIKENGIGDVVEVIGKALGNTPGFMSPAWDCPGNNMAMEYRYDDVGIVPVVTLDSISFEQLDFVKIDVEGGQLALLEGAKGTLSRFSPIIWIELNNHASSPNYDRQKELVGPQNLLAELGYKLKERLSPVDYIYVKDL